MQAESNKPRSLFPFQQLLPGIKDSRADGLSSVSNRQTRARAIQLAWLAGISGLAVLLGFWMTKSDPSPVMFAWAIYFLGLIAILYQPRYGIYLTVFFALISDSYLLWQYPFAKNFSSKESLFYVSSSLIFSPLETYIALTFISWLLHSISRRTGQFFTGPLFKPAMAFLFFILTGFAYGFYGHGDMKIGLWEVRPIFYMFAMFILASNLFTRREHTITLMWVAVAALFIEGIFGTQLFIVDLKGSLSGINQITEHAAAIQMNSVFVFAAGLWLYRGSPRKRAIILAALPVIIITWIATNRRAAYLTLIIACVVIAIIVFQNYRKTFWLVVPPLAIISALYVGIFWKSQSGSPIAKPVEALKSVVAPDQASIRDQSSNAYRVTENMNLSYTLSQKPFTGVGFGQKFYVVVPMPDISFFTWWQYLPHNSIIWIWLKTGVFGFIAMLYFVGSALMLGAQTLERAPRNEISAVLLAGSLYILMHFIYAYADISWDNKSMVYLGTIIGMINMMPALLSQALPVQPKRWPWQPEPTPEAVLLPMPGEPKS